MSDTTELLLKDINASVIKSIVGKKFFTATFIKKDGSERTMNCQVGVTKHLRGGVSTTAHKDNILTVFEQGQVLSYRNINTDTLVNLKANGKIYSFK